MLGQGRSRGLDGDVAAGVWQVCMHCCQQNSEARTISPGSHITGQRRTRQPNMTSVCETAVAHIPELLVMARSIKKPCWRVHAVLARIKSPCWRRPCATRWRVHAGLAYVPCRSKGASMPCWRVHAVLAKSMPWSLSHARMHQRKLTIHIMCARHASKRAQGSIHELSGADC